MKLKPQSDKKICTKCHTEKDLAEFCHYKQSKDQHYSVCRKCVSIRGRKAYYDNREKFKAAHRIYYQKNSTELSKLRQERMKKNKPEILKAWQKLQYAVKSGRIKKEACEICGEKIVHGHHYLGYQGEHWRDIKWLCRTHHLEAHGKKAII